MKPREIQTYLQTHGLYKGKIDGRLGPKSRAAMKSHVADMVGSKGRHWDAKRNKVAVMQLMALSADINPGPIDGLMGTLTVEAMDRWEMIGTPGEKAPETWRDYKTPKRADKWPLYSELRSFYGTPGKTRGTVRKQIIKIEASDLPYPLIYSGQKVSGVSCHEKCANAFVTALERIGGPGGHYTRGEIMKLGIDLYSGSYNPRPMRGTEGRKKIKWSTHAYGAAWDFNALRNRLRWGRDRALFARPEYEGMWEAFESVGFVSLGRERNYDWMHVQACRLG